MELRSLPRPRDPRGDHRRLGRNVFIDLGRRFQDTGGITIGDGTLIGHGTTLTTLNHSIDPALATTVLSGHVSEVVAQ